MCEEPVTPARSHRIAMSPGLELLLGPDRRKIVSPDEQKIEVSLSALPPDENCWATLSWGINNFVTATACVAGGFRVEVELGSIDLHNRISGDPLPLREIVPIFICFARKNMRWMDAFEWERVPLRDIDFRKAPDTLQGKLPGGGFFKY